MADESKKFIWVDVDGGDHQPLSVALLLIVLLSLLCGGIVYLAIT